MENCLIISNCAASNSESNGRIHFLNFEKIFNDYKIFNFYLTGCPDCKNITYLSYSIKKAIFSKFLPFYKVQISKKTGVLHNGKSKHHKKHLLISYLIRNFAFSKNKKILYELEQTIIENNIKILILWGCNVPFLYEYALKLGKKLNLKIITYTGEDYPLKKYNYFSRRPSLIFKIYQQKLYKNCKKLYSESQINLYATEDLKKHYETNLNIIGGYIVYFSSKLKPGDHKIGNSNNLVYAGNLYKERVKSLLEIADYISKYKHVKIEIFGNASKQNARKLKNRKNIVYHGSIPYNDLLKVLNEAGLLLHIEGFSKFYKKDCRFAFSTKIADYYMLNKPVFMYGAEEISGIKFAKKINDKFVATSKSELSKLDSILKGSVTFDLPYDSICEKFDYLKNNELIRTIINSVNLQRN